MSRLTSMSPEALKQIFSPDADSDLITLLTIYDEDGTTALARIADSYTQRLSETDDDVIYGVVSRSDEFTFLPMQISPPSEEEANASRCSIVMYDVSRYLIPIVRSITKPPLVKLEFVLSKSPDDVEIVFEDFYVNSFSYDAEKVSAQLSMQDYEKEPFPMYSFTPAYNPGLF